jgi:hypothetical protein
MSFTRFQLIIVLASALIIMTVAGCKVHSPTVISNGMHKPIVYDSLSWINLIDSQGINYYKVVESFDKYWEHRQRPTENDGEGADIFGKDKVNEEKEENRPIQYVYEYKRFLNWQQRNKNLVKADSTIMTAEEILEQWKKSNNEIPKR